MTFPLPLLPLLHVGPDSAGAELFTQLVEPDSQVRHHPALPVPPLIHSFTDGYSAEGPIDMRTFQDHPFSVVAPYDMPPQSILDYAFLASADIRLGIDSPVGSHAVDWYGVQSGQSATVDVDENPIVTPAASEIPLSQKYYEPGGDLLGSATVPSWRMLIESAPTTYNVTTLGGYIHTDSNHISASFSKLFKPGKQEPEILIPTGVMLEDQFGDPFEYTLRMDPVTDQESAQVIVDVQRAPVYVAAAGAWLFPISIRAQASRINNPNLSYPNFDNVIDPEDREEISRVALREIEQWESSHPTEFWTYSHLPRTLSASGGIVPVPPNTSYLPASSILLEITPRDYIPDLAPFETLP